MKVRNLEKLQLFVNKPCSILVKESSQLDQRQQMDFFMGIVESVDEDGVFSRHPATGCLNFFPMNVIVAICEEQIFYDEEGKLKKELDKKQMKPNLDYMEKMAGN